MLGFGKLIRATPFEVHTRQSMYLEHSKRTQPTTALPLKDIVAVLLQAESSTEISCNSRLSPCDRLKNVSDSETNYPYHIKKRFFKEPTG